MNGEQCRSARAMIGLSIKTLSQKMGVNECTISVFENHDRIQSKTRSKIRSFFVVSGIEFIEDDNGIGIRRRFSFEEYLSRDNLKRLNQSNLCAEVANIDFTG